MKIHLLVALTLLLAATACQSKAKDTADKPAAKAPAAAPKAPAPAGTNAKASPPPDAGIDAGPGELAPPKASGAPATPPPAVAPAQVPGGKANPDEAPVPDDFRPPNEAAEKEGGKHTTDTAQTLTVGDWTLTYALDKGRAVNNKTKAEVELWKKDPRDCDKYAFEGKLISVVGTVVTFDVRETGTCPLKPAMGQAFHTVDLTAKGDRAVALAGFFKADEVKAAFDAHPWLQNARKKPQIFKCIYKEADLGGAHFAFHGLEDGKALVRVGVGHGCDSHTGIFTQLDLKLTPDAKLLAQLQAADKAKTLGQYLHKTAQ